MSKLVLAMAAAVMLLASPHNQIEAAEALCSKKFSSHCIAYRRAPQDSDGIFRVGYIEGLRASCPCDPAAIQITG